MIKTYEELENELQLAIRQVKVLEKEKKQLQEDVVIRQECGKAAKQLKIAFDCLIEEGFSRQEAMNVLLTASQNQPIRRN